MYCFYKNTNIKGDVQICISVPLIGHGADSLICEPGFCNSYFEGLQILEHAKTLTYYLTISDRVEPQNSSHKFILKFFPRKLHKCAINKSSKQELFCRKSVLKNVKTFQENTYDRAIARNFAKKGIHQRCCFL